MKRLLALALCICLCLPPVQADTPEKLVALTFDDGPSGQFTLALLQGLARRNVPATFFLCGYRIAQYPELTLRIFTSGHEIALHGYSHDPMHTMSPDRLRRELRATLALLPEDCDPVFLRPPGGTCCDTTAAVAGELDLSILSWSVDPRDWATDDASAVIRTVLRQVRDGDVILLHDMSHSSVTAALAIVDALQARGFRFVTVSQLAAARGITPQPGQTYTHFRPPDENQNK